MYNRYNRVSAVGDALVRLVLTELRDKYLKGLDAQAVADRFGITKYQAESFVEPRSLIFRDVLELCQLMNLDIGLAVRTPEGKETTFYPGVNFTEGSTSAKPLVAAEEPAAGTSVVPGGWNGDEYGGMD